MLSRESVFTILGGSHWIPPEEVQRLADAILVAKGQEGEGHWEEIARQQGEALRVSKDVLESGTAALYAFQARVQRLEGALEAVVAHYEWRSKIAGPGGTWATIVEKARAALEPETAREEVVAESNQPVVE